MKLIKSNIHKYYPDIVKKLKNSLDINTISDINAWSNIYNGEDINFLNIFGIQSKRTDTLVSRIVGNIPPHYDDLAEFKRDVYLLVLDISVGNEYADSANYPMLYQNGKFINLHIGDLVKFNQRTEHALIWDRRIDIATFWRPYHD